MTMRSLREARVDLDAISRNVQSLRRTIGTPHFMAVVKANGYGHGAVDSAWAAVLGGADWLGVIDIVEGLELRDAGITTPILAWLHAPNENFAGVVDAGIDIGVSSLEQLERAAAAGVQNVQLKVDTGLSRNGAEVRDWQHLFERAVEFERAGAVHVRGLFSHLANAGTEEDGAQVASFDRAIALAASVGLSPELIHLASTAGALREPATRYDLVRIGLGIYGLSPFDGTTSAELGLTPALELSAEVVLVKRVPAGSGVSYGFHYRTTAETTLVLVPVGYGDGIPRQASNRGPVSINGATYRVAGTVAMDQVVVDVGDASVAVGDRAVLFGDPATGVPSATDWADASDTINYEIVTRLGGRIQRSYLGEQ